MPTEPDGTKSPPGGVPRWIASPVIGHEPPGFQQAQQLPPAHAELD